MPPKRKQPAVKETKVEEHLSEGENNVEEAAMDAKPVDEVEEKPRRGKAAKGKVEEEELEEPKEKKLRGRVAKKVADEEVEEEKPKKSGRPAKADKPKRGRKKAEENGDAKEEDVEKPKRGGKAKSDEGDAKKVDDEKKTEEDRESSANSAPESAESDAEDDVKKGKNGKAPSKSGSVDSKASRDEDEDKTEDEKVSDAKESEEEGPAPVEVAKPKRGRAAKAAAIEEAKPKKGRGAKKPAEPIAPADERPKRNKAAKKYYDDEEDNEDGEPIVKKSKEELKEAKQAKEAAKEEAKIAREAAKEEARIAKEEAKAAKEKKDEEAKHVNQTSSDYSTMEFGCEKKNELGQEFNFKISSWNVDGLRAWFKKDGLLYVENEKPDIICFQETKCSEDKLPDEVKDVEGYEKYWLGGEKEGYAGVSVFSKTKPIEVKYGIGDETLDEEGRCITLEYEKFYLINTYVPNTGRKLVNMDKRLEWNKLFKDYVKKLDEIKPVIVCGDLNVAHNEIDLSNPKSNKKNAGFSQEERDGMTDFLESGFVDTYRKLYPDATDVYTFWTYMMKSRSKNIGWRLDYFLVSERFMETICDSVIRDKIFGSDHCPITLFLSV